MYMRGGGVGGGGGSGGRGAILSSHSVTVFPFFLSVAVAKIGRGVKYGRLFWSP